MLESTKPGISIQESALREDVSEFHTPRVWLAVCIQTHSNLASLISDQVFMFEESLQILSACRPAGSLKVWPLAKGCSRAVPAAGKLLVVTLLGHPVSRKLLLTHTFTSPVIAQVKVQSGSAALQFPLFP